MLTKEQLETPLDYLSFDTQTDSRWDKYKLSKVTQSPVRSEETRNLTEIVVEVTKEFPDSEGADYLLEHYVSEKCISPEEAADIRRIAFGDFPVSAGSSFPPELHRGVSGNAVGMACEWIIRNANRRQPELSFFAALHIVSVLTCRKIVTSHGDRPTLYTLGLAPSASGKEWPRQAIKQILTAAGAGVLLGSESVTGATAIVTALEGHPVRVFPIDEAGHMLRGMKGPKADSLATETEALMLKMTGASSDPAWQPKGYAKADRNKTISHPCTSFMMTSTPASMKGALDASSVAEGLVGRCTIWKSDRVDRLRTVVRTPPPEELIEWCRMWFEYMPNDLWLTNPAERVIEFSDDALECFYLATIRWDALSETLTEEQGSSSWRRALEKAKKVALIVCAAERMPTDEPFIIEKRHAELGVAFIHVSNLNLVKTVASDMLMSKRERDIESVVSYVKRRGSKKTTVRDYSNNFRQWDAKYRSEILHDAVESEAVIAIEVSTGGRKRTELSFNPEASA